MKTPFSRTAFELLVEQAAAAPERPAAICGAETVSFADLAERARRLAQGMRDGGVGRGARIGLLSDNRIEWLEVFFAANALGATLVPFSTWSTKSELEFLLADSAVSGLFSIDGFGERDFLDDIEAIRAAGTAPALGRVTALGGGDYQSLRAARPLPDLAPGLGEKFEAPQICSR